MLFNARLPENYARARRLRCPEREKAFMKKSFRALKRLELVELIYQLRKDNLDLRRRCKELENQLEKAEGLVAMYASRTDEEALSRIETMLADLYHAQTAGE